MAFSMKHKLAAILVVSVVFSLSTAGVFLYYFLASYHRREARAHITNAYVTIRDEIRALESLLEDRMSNLRNRESLVASMYVVAEYQGYFASAPEMLDEEKKKIARELSDLIQASRLDLAVAREPGGLLAAFAAKTPGDRLFMGIFSRGSPEERAMILDDNGTGWTPGALPDSIPPRLETAVEGVDTQPGGPGDRPPRRVSGRAYYEAVSGGIQMSLASPLIRQFQDGETITVGHIRLALGLRQGFIREMSARTRTEIRLFLPDGQHFGTLSEKRVRGELPEATCVIKGQINDYSGWFETDDYFFHVCSIPLAEGGGAYMVLGSDKSLLQSTLKRIAWVLAGTLFLSAVLVTVIGLVAGHHAITQRVDRLRAAVARFEQGRQVDLMADSQDELGDLARSFANMTETLQRREAEIRRHQDHLEERVWDRTEALNLKIAELRRTEDLLKSAKTAAESAAMAKSQFLAVMSHEMRTPMNAIIGMTDHLLTSGPGEDQREHLEIIQSAAEHLLILINDILDLSRIEAGKLRLERIPFDAEAQIRQALRALAAAARDKGLDFSLRFAPPAPGRLTGDINRLKQILYNLIGNAIKFTDTGGVTVTISGEAIAGGPRYRLQCVVADTGIGISPDMLEAIFQPFTQTDASNARRHAGTGLGLSISRRLVNMMGGDLTVTSRPCAGSAFTFTVILDLAEETGVDRPKPPAPAEAPASDVHDIRGIRVLLVEDNAFNQRVAGIMLERLGCVMETAASGEEALSRLEGAGPEGRHFDIIFMDIQMPGMDGFQTTAAIRNREAAGGRRLPIVAMTAHAMEGDRERCLHGGMDDYLTKPIRPTELAEVIARNAPARGRA